MLGPHGYAPHEAYVAPARGSAGALRLVMGVLLIEALYAAATQATDAMLMPLPPAWTDGYYFGTTRLGLIAQLFSFGLLGAAVILTARVLHDRGPFSLLGQATPPGNGLAQMRRVTLAVLGLFLLTELLPPYWSLSGMEVAAPLSWLALLPVSLLALTVQIGAEEIFYRGYVQQQLAARFRSPLIWMTLPNVLFAYAHWDAAAPLNEAVEYVVWAFFFGLAASDLTARTGSLGAAAGFHLANNIYAFLFFGDIEGPDNGLALFLFSPDDAAGPADLPEVFTGPWVSSAFLVELGIVVLMWLAARLALRR